MTEIRYRFISLDALPGYARLIFRRKKPILDWRSRGSEVLFDQASGSWIKPRVVYRYPHVETESVIEAYGCFVNSRGTVLSPEGEILWGYESGLGPERKRAVGRIIIGPELPGTWIHGLHNDRHFGHWLLHRLPKASTGLRTFPQSPILTSSASWDASALLASIGADASSIRFLPWDDFETFYPVGRLIISNDLAPDKAEKLVDPRRIRYLAHTVLDWARSRSRLEPASTIYLSRRPGSGIREGCRNREVIEDLVRAKGVEIVYPETMPFADQVVLVSGASEILSEYGSASILSLFADRLKTFTLLSPRANYRFKNGVARGAPWVRSIVMAKGRLFRYASVADGADLKSWEANPDMVWRVFAQL